MNRDFKVKSGSYELDIVLDTLREHAPPPWNEKLSDLETLRKVVNGGDIKVPKNCPKSFYESRCTVHRLAVEARQETGKNTRGEILGYILAHPYGKEFNVFQRETLYNWISEVIDFKPGRPKK